MARGVKSKLQQQLQQRSGKDSPPEEEVDDFEEIYLEENPSLDRISAVVLSIVLVALVSSMYLLTVYPTIPGGDSPELIVAACELGVAHPPGYPTFTLMGYLFTILIPFGTIAFRVNLLSVSCGVGAAFFLFHTTRRWAARSFPQDGLSSASVGFLAGGMYSLCHLVWMYSIQAEVFAMNNLFVALLLFLTEIFWEKRNLSSAVMGAFFIGLGLTNQHTLILYAIPIVLWTLYVGRSFLLKPAAFGLLCVAGAVALVPYLYIVWAGSVGPPGSWGDTSTLDGFLVHFLRKEYGTFRLFSGNEAQTGSQLGQALSLYSVNLSQLTFRLGFPLILIGAIGGMMTRKRRFLSGDRGEEKEKEVEQQGENEEKKKTTTTAAVANNKGNSSTSGHASESGELEGGIQSFGFVLVFAYIFYMVVFHSLSNLPLDKALYFGVHIRFWMQPHAVAVTLMSYGVAFLIHQLRKRSVPVHKYIVFGVCVVLVLAQVAKNFNDMNQSDNFTIQDYGYAHLSFLPPNATLIVKGDLITNSIRYLQCCENMRPDVTHLDQSMMTYKWFKKTQQKHLTKKRNLTLPGEFYNPYEKNAYSLGELLDEYANDQDYPMYLCGGWYHEEPQGSGGIQGYSLLPFGTCDRIVAADDVPTSLGSWWDEAKEAIPPPTPSWPASREKYPQDTWEAVATNDYWGIKHKYAFFLLNKAIELNNDMEMLQECIGIFETLMAEHGDPCPDYMHKNIGIAYGRLRSYDGHNKMAEHFRKFLALNKDTSDPQLAEIRRVVEDWDRQVEAMHGGAPPAGEKKKKKKKGSKQEL